MAYCDYRSAVGASDANILEIGWIETVQSCQVGPSIEVADLASVANKIAGHQDTACCSEAAGTVVVHHVVRVGWDVAMVG